VIIGERAAEALQSDHRLRTSSVWLNAHSDISLEQSPGWQP
jgi:hypothetical protein